MPSEAHINDFDDFDDLADELLDEALDAEFDATGAFDHADASPHARAPSHPPPATFDQLYEALATTDPRALAAQLGCPLTDLLDVINRRDFAEVAGRHSDAFRALAVLRATAALPDAIEALRAVCAESDDQRQRRLAATALLRFLTRPPRAARDPAPAPPGDRPDQSTHIITMPPPPSKAPQLRQTSPTSPKSPIGPRQSPSPIKSRARRSAMSRPMQPAPRMPSNPRRRSRMRPRRPTMPTRPRKSPQRLSRRPSQRTDTAHQPTPSRPRRPKQEPRHRAHARKPATGGPPLRGR